VALLLTAASVVVSAVRWAVLARALGAELRLGDSTRLSFVGFFFNQLLPSNFGGDVFRAAGLYRIGLAPRLAVTATLLDRLAALIGIVLFLVLFLPLTPALRQAFGWWPSPVLAAGTLAGLGLLMILDRLPHSWRRLALLDALAAMALDCRRVFLRPEVAGPVLAASLVCQLLVSLIYVAFAWALGLTSLDLYPFLVVVPAVMLLSALPVSVAGWGVRESAVVAGFGLVGVPKESALLMALSFGLACLLVSLPGGWLWLSLKRRSAQPSEEPGGHA
jgi:uncharacterized membrane protein YbhN (UPF0104 family)